ncbi:MAG: hypothetical protein RLZZ623_75 [Actinomycetota bacterium]|jgi:uncharacterized protein with FMN-binding domain
MNPSSSPKPSLARRALPALVLTGASGLLLTALDRPSSTVGASASDGVGTATGAVGAPTVISTPASNTPTAPAATNAPAATVADAPAATVAPAAPVAPATTVASAVPPAPACTIVDGPTITTRYGPVQVEASVASDGTICAVDAIQAPSRDGKSARISNYSVPILDQSAMAAQSAKFNGVSGATYTSTGYRKSLQSILDGLG